MICSRRSSAAIRGAGLGSAESTLFFNVITGGIGLIFFSPPHFFRHSSFLSTFTFSSNIRRETPFARRPFVSMRLLTTAARDQAS
jgi:hypothetical protein